MKDRGVVATNANEAATGTAVIDGGAVMLCPWHRHLKQRRCNWRSVRRNRVGVVLAMDPSLMEREVNDAFRNEVKEWSLPRSIKGTSRTSVKEQSAKIEAQLQGNSLILFH